MTSYVQAINKKYSNSGTLFQGKAKAKPVDSDEYVLQLIRYIHLNPVTAGIVKAPQEWPYSDYCDWIRQTSPTLLRDRRGSLRDTYFSNAKEYRQFVEEFQNEQQNSKLDKFLFSEE